MRSDDALHATLRLARSGAATTASPDSPYREWVETYAEPTFEQLATTLEDLLDRLGGEPEVVAGHYRTAMRLELAFFGAIHEHAW